MTDDLGEAAVRVLGLVMAARGLVVESCSTWSVVFRDERREVELSCYREDPVPWLDVVLGLHEEDAVTRVALWRLVPELSAPDVLASMRFSSAESLERCLGVLRDDWLTRFVWPMLEEPGRLRAASLLQEEERDASFRAAEVDRLRRLARRAYDSGDLAGAAEQYAALDPEALTAPDRRRWHDASIRGKRQRE